MKPASLASLQVEMGDPPYGERRKSLIAKSYLNIISFDNTHPTKITLQDDVMFRFYDKNIKSKQTPYCITAQDVFRENNFNPDNTFFVYIHIVNVQYPAHGIYKNPLSKTNCIILLLKRTSLT